MGQTNRATAGHVLLKTAVGLFGLVPLAGATAMVATAERLTRRRETLTVEEAAAADAEFLALDGARIHYLVGGTGPTVLFVHGLAASTFSWRHNIAPFATTRRVCALDLPGFGYSSRSSIPRYTLRQGAATLRALLDRLGERQATLVGNSLGGAIALQFAHDYPDRVDKLVLVSAAAYRVVPFPFARWPLARALIRLTIHNMVGSEWRLAQLLRRIYGDPALVTPAVVAGYYRPLQIRGSADALWAMLASRPDQDIPRRLSAIKTPALLIWGDRDTIVPLADGRRLARDLPDARLVVMPGVGHAPQEEQPEAFNRLVAEFLS